MNPDNKLDQWLSRAFNSAVQNMILDDGRGEILAFGVFYLKKNNDGVDVYKNDVLTGSFCDRRTALSWCVAEKFNRVNLARSLRNLDLRRRYFRDDFKVRQSLLTHSKTKPFQDRVANKLLQRQTYLNSIEHQLENCIRQAKYLQIRGFQNETARACRT